MTDNDAQIFGAISAIEFVLEVVLANALAQQDQPGSDAFKADLTSRSGYLKKGPISVDDVQAVEKSMQARLVNFVEKVTARETDIRDKIAQPR